MSSRIALFTTSDLNYFEKSIQTFKTYSRLNPNTFDCFIIISKVSDKHVKFAESNGVNVIQLDLSNSFKIENGWPYPSECFWLFKGPDLFLEMGYQHSMYVDADTVCLQKLEFDWLDDSFVLAGSARLDINSKEPVKSIDFLQKTEKNFKNLVEAIPEVNVNNEIIDINSGILFFNNKKWSKYKMYRRSLNLFARAKECNAPRKGDDSLLSLLQISTPPEFYKTLDFSWNYYYDRPNTNSTIGYNDIKIIHLTKIKPWIAIGDVKRIKNNNIKRAVMVWHQSFLQSNMKPLKPSHNLWWYRSPKEYNFGDEITPWLIQHMFSFKQDKPCDPRTENVLLAVGSIMRLSGRNTEVWGSGIRNIDQMDFKRAKRVYAVRGLFTRQRLLELKHECPQVYGDPGLLLPSFYNPTDIKKKYKLGIIPHIVDYAFVESKFKDREDVLLIDLKTNQIEEVVDKILQCENVLSTSLHGIITAVAYNIPVRWYKVSDKINGDDIKFYDFFSSLDHQVFHKFDRIKFKSYSDKYEPLRFNDNHSIDDLINSTYLYDKKDFDEYRLLKSCPFEIIEQD